MDALKERLRVFFVRAFQMPHVNSAFDSNQVTGEEFAFAKIAQKKLKMRYKLNRLTIVHVYRDSTNCSFNITSNFAYTTYNSSLVDFRSCIFA